MKERLLDFLACPYDGAFPLALKSIKAFADEIEEGCLICPTCGKTFTIKGGIPRMVTPGLTGTSSPADKVTQDKRTEMKVRDEQVSTYLKWVSEYNTFLEFHASLELLALMPNDILLDVGCGIGRITALLSSLCKEIIAIDYSAKSLQYLQKTIGQSKITNIHLIQADSCLLPLRENCFDKAISNQVFTFIPSPDEKSKALTSVYHCLRQNGVFVLTVFNNHIFRSIKRFLGKPGVFDKEGYHPVHNFYYYNFSVFDLRIFLRTLFWVREIRGLQNLTREFGLRLKMDHYGKVIMAIDNFIGKTPLSYLLGDLLIAKCIKQ